MERERRNRDYSKGPVWDAATNRWLVEIRYPDGSRFRRRLRREREALRLWASGAGEARGRHLGPTRRAQRQVATRVGTVPRLFEGPTSVARHLHRAIAHAVGRQHLGPQTHLAKVSSQQVEDFKLKRAQTGRAQHDRQGPGDPEGVLQLVHRASTRRVESGSPREAVPRGQLAPAVFDARGVRPADRGGSTLKGRANTPSPYLEEKIVLATHTGLRRGSLFDLRWEQIDLANSVMRIPRTKSGRPLSVPLNATAKGTLEKLQGPRPGEPVRLPAQARQDGGRTGA